MLKEVVRRVGSGQVEFVAQVEDAQLASGAHLASESWGRPHTYQYQQATGQEQCHKQPLQPVGGGYGAAVQTEALLAVPVS